jgi:hypothetical protein
MSSNLALPFTRAAVIPLGFLIASIGYLFKKYRSHLLLAADFFFAWMDI